MNIHNPALFSVVLPTYDGTRFLKRVLDYFRTMEFKGQIALSDNSAEDHRIFVSSCQDRYPDLRIKTFTYPRDVRFLDKIVDTMEQIDSRFVMLHAHDDFMVPYSVEVCVNFLTEHPDYSVARGRVAMFGFGHEGSSGQRIQIVPHPMRAYEQQNPVDRMIAHIESYASTFYSVHDRRALMESFKLTEAATKNVIFFQYLSSCIAAMKGKIWCSEDLFYVRQGHADSWSGTLKQGNYEHWPLLITSPNFSTYYQEFRSAISSYVKANLGNASIDIEPRIDQAALGLFQRAYCSREGENPGEVQFIKKLHDPQSDEYKALGWIIDFIKKYPETM